MSSAHVDSHYARTASDHAPFPALTGAVDADVCVIGGGLAGLSTAMGLAERGCSVVLLEARRVGWGASGRNGGFVAPGFALSAERLAAKLGPDHARRLYQLSREAVGTVRRRIAEHAIDCGPVVDGWLTANWRHRPDATRRKRDWLAETFGHELDYWPQERLGEVLRSARYHDGLYDPEALQIHPLNYCLGLADAATKAGARLFEHSPATAFESDGVVTEAGRVRAGEVVVACGGYADGLVRRLKSAIVPVATSIMVTEPLGDRLREAIRVDCAVSDTRRAGNYYRALSDGRILWGGRMTAWTREPRDLAGLLLRDMLDAYPQLAGVRAETAWSGLMGYATHQMPQIGRLRPGLWVASAFGGHGLNTTAMAGELVAAAIAEGDERHAVFAPFGLRPVFGPLGAAAAQATYWSYRLRDAWG